MRISGLKSKLLLTALFLCAVAGLYLSKIYCVFRTFFGFTCPGCGMTRAYLALLRLDLGAAFRFHPMFWSVPILYVYFLKDGGLFPHRRWDHVLLIVIGAGFLVNWLIKLF